MDDTKIQLFDNPDFGHLRVTIQDDEPWFVAADVAKALGYRDAEKMTRRLDEDEKDTRSVGTLGGNQQMTTISEGGLYAAVLGSKIPGAHAFKRWVTHEVLPSIRRTGSYSLEDDNLTMARGLIAAQGIVKRLQAENDDLTEENALMAPKAAYYDSVMDADGLLSVRDSAKLLKSHDKSITDHGLRASLRHDHIIEQRTLHATAYGIERGYVTERPFTIPHSDGTKTVKHYGCLTPKGLDWCVRRYCGKGVA